MEEQGESAFRDLEMKTLKQVANESPRVIALGGGALLREENRRYAEELWLNVCEKSKTSVHC